jgi:ADP-heptose:LPS heptosyltransferase
MPRPVVIEPTVKDMGACVGANKQWPIERYLRVAAGLADDGEFPVSLGPTRGGWDVLPRVITETFRDALCVLSLARLYIGPEGGLHHAAAALGVPAVVIFGGFSSPAATGYPWHVNIAAPGKPCGSTAYCAHCRDAMAAITVERVLEAARAELDAADAKRRRMSA